MVEEKTKRAKGRPRKGEAPALPVEELDRLLVFGELVTAQSGQAPTVHFPSYSELAERFSVSSSLIAKYAAEHNCQARREQNQARVEAKTEQKMVDLRSELSAKTKEDELRIIDGYIEGFEQALTEGRIRFDNPADFNSMVRLKQFVLGGADSRSEINTSISLDEIQERHKKQLQSLVESPVEVFGVSKEMNEKCSVDERSPEEDVGGEKAGSKSDPD